jgi:GGDEF domain-containing protein
MVQIRSKKPINDSQLIALSEVLLYCRNQDDIVIRWSNDTFAIVGYEKDDNVRELTQYIINRLQESFKDIINSNIAYSFYPFDREQPMKLSWDQISVMVEQSLNLLGNEKYYQWVGLYQPQERPFNYLEFLKINKITELEKLILIKQG